MPRTLSIKMTKFFSQFIISARKVRLAYNPAHLFTPSGQLRYSKRISSLFLHRAILSRFVSWRRVKTLLFHSIGANIVLIVLAWMFIGCGMVVGSFFEPSTVTGFLSYFPWSSEQFYQACAWVLSVNFVWNLVLITNHIGDLTVVFQSLPDYSVYTICGHLWAFWYAGTWTFFKEFVHTLFMDPLRIGQTGIIRELIIFIGFSFALVEYSSEVLCDLLPSLVRSPISFIGRIFCSYIRYFASLFSDSLSVVWRWTFCFLYESIAKCFAFIYGFTLGTVIEFITPQVGQRHLQVLVDSIVYPFAKAVAALIVGTVAKYIWDIFWSWWF